MTAQRGARQARGAGMRVHSVHVMWCRENMLAVGSSRICATCVFAGSPLVCVCVSFITHDICWNATTHIAHEEWSG